MGIKKIADHAPSFSEQQKNILPRAQYTKALLTKAAAEGVFSTAQYSFMLPRNDKRFKKRELKTIGPGGGRKNRGTHATTKTANYAQGFFPRKHTP